MSKSYPHIIPNEENWPIYQQAKNRSSFIGTLNQFSQNRILNSKSDLEKILSLTVYQEKQRVKNNPWKVDPPDDKKYWSKIQTELQAAVKAENSEEALQQLLLRIINRYNEEIVGDFKPKTFAYIKKFLLAFYKRLLNPMFNKGSWRPWGTKEQLFDKLDINGPVDHMRTLFSKGTVLVLPTHFSNLDSIMVGYILDSVCGVPPFAYGAGLNLFDYEIPAYFMNRLGAYRVDRRKKNPIYLECLKAYNCFSVYQGVNNIFFPGGTRSRSGAIEDRLKLGLLGSVVQAQRMHVERGEDKKIFIVPMIMDYNFVLEAKSLIEFNLRSEGKENYNRSKDKIGFFKSNYRFLKALFTKSSEVVVNFGHPTDVLGNPVDIDGNSLDSKGKIIDFATYFTGENSSAESNDQREKIYTRLLGEKVQESFRKNNIAIASHVLAFVAFEMLKNMFMKSDYYTFLSTPIDELEIPMDSFKQKLVETIGNLKILESFDEIKTSHRVDIDKLDEMIRFGLDNIGIYHAARVLYIENDLVKTEDLRLLLYYRNKLSGYKLEEKLCWTESENLK